MLWDIPQFTVVAVQNKLKSVFSSNEAGNQNLSSLVATIKCSHSHIFCSPIDARQTSPMKF